MEKRDAKGLTEAEFLAIYKERAGKYPRPFLTADCVILTPGDTPQTRKVLMIRRGGHPYLDCLALPGGFANENEPLCESARRELAEETGVDAHPVLLGVYSEPGRDPRGWIVSTAFLADLPFAPEAKAADDARDAAYLPIRLDGEDVILTALEGEIRLCAPDYRAAGVAFDHGRMLGDALRRVIRGEMA